jgi:hypothetical protein
MIDATDLQLTQLVDELMEEMEEGNLALTLFDGGRFARHAMEESRICSTIEGLLGDQGHPVPVPLRLKALDRRRRLLLKSTQRTVRALWGVHAAAFSTYQAPQLSIY